LSDLPESGAIAAEAFLPALHSLLSGIPEEFKPLASLGIGAFILVCLVLFHGAGLHHILRLTRRGERGLLASRPHLLRAGFLFGGSIFLMLALHIAEILMWAFTLNHLGLIARVHDSIYFCANAYTTLGYGTIALEQPWRNISPVIAISGLFTFAWTTSTLVDVVRSHGALIEQLEDEREQELQLRMHLGKAEWDALKKERDAERSEKEKARTQLAGASFLQRRKIRKDERARVKELRNAKAAEIRDLRRKEYDAEEKLGPETPPTDSPAKK
jgi:hypothetical protein